ncbi:hypothetical protein Pelo_7039 [Pelomyxa schiedti]|nr:hypothetical protein Pelo_7039 [Pelomyxa schiedti]
MESKSGKGSRASVGDDEGGCVLPAGRRLLNAHIGSLKDLKVVQRGDRSLLISCDEIGHYGLWDLNGPCTSPACFVKGAHSASINSLAVMEVASLLVTASDDTTMRLWDLTKMCIDSSPVVEMTGHSSFVSACACATDSPVIASCSLDSTIRIHGLQDIFFCTMYILLLQQCALFQGQQLYWSVLVVDSSSGIFVYIKVIKKFSMQLRLMRMKILDKVQFPLHQQEKSPYLPLQQKHLIDRLHHRFHHKHLTVTLKFSGTHHKEIISAAIEVPNEFLTSCLELSFNLSLGTLLRTKKCYSVIPSSDGRHVLSSSTDNTHKLWEASKFTVRIQRALYSTNLSSKGEFTFDGADLSTQIQPAFSSDDKYIACGSADGFVYIWESFSGADASAPLKIRA